MRVKARIFKSEVKVYRNTRRSYWIPFVLGVLGFCLGPFFLLLASEAPDFPHFYTFSLFAAVFSLIISLPMLLDGLRGAFETGQDWPHTSIGPGQYDVCGLMQNGDRVTLAIRHENKEQKQTWLRLYEMPRNAFVGELVGNTLTVTKGPDYCHYRLFQSVATA